MASGQLQTYHSTRNFRRSAGPRGRIDKRKSAALQFMIQKQAAARLPYGLRLEWDGVFKFGCSSGVAMILPAKTIRIGREGKTGPS